MVLLKSFSTTIITTSSSSVRNNDNHDRERLRFNTKRRQYTSIVFWYFLFGAIHEVTHLVTAMILYPQLLQQQLNGSNGLDLVIEILFQRHCHIVGLAEIASTQGIDLIRNSGWIVSLLLALLIPSTVQDAQLAAIVTAIEALSTDLMQWKTAANSLPGFLLGSQPYPSSKNVIFWCGNFGIILLHHKWFTTDNGTPALSVLQKMIEVTMMRGAQSGGVITYQPTNYSKFHRNKHMKLQYKGVRSRVVNGKRTDLSHELRRKVQHDVFGGSGLLTCGTAKFPKDLVTVLSGHTRFATSSISTLDGTHPQQWTPVTKRRVYNFSVPKDDSIMYSPAVEPQVVMVENYITHNGDFDFYKLNGTTYDLQTIQKWLIYTTQQEMPAAVDSCAVAGMVDLLRTQGCFGLSARYALCLGLPTSKMNIDEPILVGTFPKYQQFEKIGLIFENVLQEMIKVSSTTKGTTVKSHTTSITLDSIAQSSERRHSFALRVATKLRAQLDNLVVPIAPYLKLTNEDRSGRDDTDDTDGNVDDIDDDEEGANPSGLLAFCKVTIDAFFDNDLFFTTKTFLKNAKGSFGLCFTSSLDTHRQICLAARGQTMSIAFYPRKGLICYGSEQAAVKAGMNAMPFPDDADDDRLGKSQGDIDNDALRLDLDDLGGEIIVIDWGHRSYKNGPVSKPNHDLVQHKLMNGGVTAILSQESKSTTQDPQLYHRMTCLSRNRFIKPLPEVNDMNIDPIQRDIHDMPKICQSIQEDWQANRASSSLNRLTAYNLSRCLRKRLENHVAGTIHHPQAIDILLTGCEVSLWLAEQFASDLQKCFPRLNIKAVSSNKLLGLYGQEVSVPALGFPYASNSSHYLHDAIIIIVSHSGGTFGPLSCSNLLQSTTNNIFVVTSEWDTQIGKQLRAMDTDDNNLFNSRIFSTEVGMRPAEPCSVSVVATHQLLTNLLEYMCVIILSDPRFRAATGAIITEQDLKALEKCNQMNVKALVEIVGANRRGYALDRVTSTEAELRAKGDVWADHILENANAYIMSIVYILATVISGFPLFYGIASSAGLTDLSNTYWIYLVRALDAALYIWLPQVNITLLRLYQQRDLLHRMVGRTVVIGDIPWVAQSAEAFLSKIFACSYSIAGLNVLSGNPSDHLVHRHTHRVVRGTLVVVGRPDGRLSALSTAEAACCLSVNQASSIQSLGGTCESITIGHNPFKLDLSKAGIFLRRMRPLFLCERILIENDVQTEQQQIAVTSERTPVGAHCQPSQSSPIQRLVSAVSVRNRRDCLDTSAHSLDASVRPKILKHRSAAALLGAYMNIEEGNKSSHFGVGSQGTNDISSMEPTTEIGMPDETVTVDDVVRSAVKERKFSDKARKLFQALDLDGNGFLSQDDFVRGANQVNPALTESHARALFLRADDDGSGYLDYDDFLGLLRSSNLDQGVRLPPSHHDNRGIIHIEASDEKYFGETIRKYNAGKSRKDVDFMLARSQHFCQELYETRIASLQRYVAMVVMFHQMGKRVQEFFPRTSFGLWGYRMDRTHSIMRIATTASPVSGADVRQRMRHLRLHKKVQHSINVISEAYLQYKKRKEMQRVKELEKRASSASS